MGILNTTPDSFSDGGNSYSDGRLDLDLAVRRAADMQAQGASLIDIGGESTRPGAAPVSLQEEMDRVLAVIERVAAELDVIVSVDTSRPEIIAAAAAAGAGLINDVRALQQAGALEAAAATGLPVCLMHMQGKPQTMQAQPSYQSVISEVGDFFTARVEACNSVGIRPDQILLDPGFGFGKSLQHNVELLQRLGELAVQGMPLLIGMSRKSMLQGLLGRPVEERLAGSLGLAMLALQNGASILRVHDVAQSRDILELYWQIVAQTPAH